MQNFIVQKQNQILNGSLYITGSKSESNRLLILQALYPNQIQIENISDSFDTKILQNILNNTNINKINVDQAGTVMRFLTAYFSVKSGKEVILTGSDRMKQRPINILVNALKSLGAEIDYLENKNYPPIKIIGKKLSGGTIKINTEISSQYISALMLIGSSLEKGLEILLSGKIISLPYIQMTYNLLKKFGINILWNDRRICIQSRIINQNKIFSVESDWSSASYYYALSALSKNCMINLHTYKKNSLQGDSFISIIYNKYFGINTIFENNKIFLQKKLNYIIPNFIKLDLNSTPDIAQTIVVTCVGLKVKCFLTGLESLKIKETDRLQALQNELSKIGIETSISANSFQLINFSFKEKNYSINTYQDHRMAMAFACLSICFPIKIFDPQVVKKSYPNFWIDLKNLGFSIN